MFAAASKLGKANRQGRGRKRRQEGSRGGSATGSIRMLIILSRWFVLHYAGDKCPRTTREAVYHKHNKHTYKKHMHAWPDTYIPYARWNISSRSYSQTHPDTKTNNNSVTHACLQARALSCDNTAWLHLTTTSNLPSRWNIHTINNCSIINRLQNGSNCSLQPNASISIPRIFHSKLRRKKRHWYAEYSLRCYNFRVRLI